MVDEERINSLRADIAAQAAVAPSEVQVVRSPYRICPLGAHVDHQLGEVTGMALEEALLLGFVPRADSLVQVRSRNFEGTVEFTLDQVPPHPVGDWGAAIPVPGEVNTDDYAEGFPWMVELPGEGLHLFFNRAPEIAFTEPMAVYDSTWVDGAWATPVKIIDIPPTGDPGGVLVIALPSVAVGDFGVELFFVYVLTHPSGELNFQLGVVPRVAD